MIHPLSGHAYGLRIYAVLLATSYAIVPAVGSPPKTGTMQLQRFDQFGDPLPEGASARMGTTRFRAGASMSDVAYSRDGKSIITSAIDQIDVWETGSGKRLRHFAGFSVRRKNAPIEFGSPFAISPDQNHLAAGGADGRIRIYQLGSAKSLIEWETPGAKEFFGRRPAIRNLVYSPDGRTLLTVEDTAMVRLWSVGSGAELRVVSEPYAGVLAIAFSPDGKLIAYAHTDKSIRLCAVESGKEVIRCAGHPDFARVLRFNPDGKIIASALFEYTHSKEKDNSVRLWDVVTGKELQRLHGNDRGTPLAFSPDGTSLATSADGSVRIWDPAAGTERLHFKAHSQGILKGIRALEFSPDGKRLVSCGIDQTVHEWDAATGKEIEPMGGHQARLLAAAFSPDNRVLASASEDQTIRLWEVATGSELRRYDVDDLVGGSSMVGTQLRFSPDGRRLFANCSGPKIRSWDLASGREVSLLAEQGRIPACLAISRDGRLLIASETPGSAPDPSARGAVSLWDTVTGRRVRRLEDVSRAVFQVGISSGGVFGIALDIPESKVLLFQWDAPTGKLIREQDAPLGDRTFSAVSAVSLSEAGRVFACARFDPSTQRPGTVIPVLDTANNQELRTLRTPSRIYKALAIGPDCRTITTLEQNGEIHRWELATGKERRSFKGHRGIGRVLAFSNDNTMLASGADDTTIVIWDLQGRLERSGVLPTDRELDAFWSDLKSDDALLAEQAVRGLVAGGKRTVALIGRHVGPVQVANDQIITRLVYGLNSEHFEERAQAMAELTALDESAMPGLRRALAGPLSLECRRRIESLLDAQIEARRNPAGDRLRLHPGARSARTDPQSQGS